jgi:hypothetical protein
VSASVPSGQSTPTTPSRSNRGLLIGGLVTLLVVCVCVILAAALGGGLFLSGKLGVLGQGSPTPVAVLVVTPTSEGSSTPVVVPVPSSLPTDASSPTSPRTSILPASPAAQNSPTATLPATSAPPSTTAQQAPNWPVVLSDDFSSNQNDWNITTVQPDTSDYGTVNETLGGGKLRLEASAKKGVNFKYWPKGLQPVSDLAVTVDGARVSGGAADYGLVFRKDPDGNCYVFLIRDDKKQYAVFVYHGGWATLIDWTDSDAIQTGQVNHLGVTALGSHFTFFINNQQVNAVDNSQVLSGLVGVTLDMNANSQATFEFSNFALQAPAVTVQATPVGPVALATTSSTGQWPIVFSDNFDTNVNGWNISDQQPYTSDYGSFDEKLGGGSLTVDAKVIKSVDEKYWPKNLKPLSDLSVSVSARRTSGPSTAEYGLIFRRGSNNDFYLFEIRDTKEYGVWLYQGKWITLVDWTNSDAINPGQVNKLSVTATGSHFEFSINDQEVGTVDNSQLISGVAGLAIDMDANQEAVIEFSNFQVRAPSGSSLATPAPPPRMRVVLSDGFSSNSNGWNIADQQPGSDDYGTYNETIGGGKLSIGAQVVKGTNQKRWPNIAGVSDFSVSIDARQVSGPSGAVYGLMFRRDTDGNFYEFEIRDDKQFSVWEFNGQWTDLIALTESDAIQPGQLNRLNVTGIGSHFTFTINNQQVGTLDNSQISSGLVGVMFEMDPGEAVFEYSKFELDTP